MKTEYVRQGLIFVSKDAVDRENRIVYAATMHCFSQFEKSLKRELTREEKLDLGGAFEEVESFIRREVRLEGDYYPDSILLNVIMSYFNRGLFPELAAIFAKAIKAKG